MTDDEPTEVVTVFLRNAGEVVLLRRSDEVGSSPGRWGGVAGHAEREAAAIEGSEASEGRPARDRRSLGPCEQRGAKPRGPCERAEPAKGRRSREQTGSGATRERSDPDGAAHEEIREETGIDPATLDLVRRGEPFPVEDGEYAWRVHPYLFDCTTREVETNDETAGYEWVPPTEILRRETSEASERRAGEARETVPDLWTSYDRLRPTPGTIAEDAEHGSSYLSLRALECLRDEAAIAVERAGDWEDLASVARDLRSARPSMAVVANRVNRAMHEASGERDAVERAAVEGHRRAREADAGAATLDPDWDRVLTLSRSGTVRRALLGATALERVFVAESRPAREGVGVAERLAGEYRVTLHTDAAVAHVLATHQVDAVVVGADAVLADGSVVNKTGTRSAALAADREDVPLHAVCAADKISPDEEPRLEAPGLVTAVRTERGPLDTGGIRAVAREHADLAGWE
ncbi:initiation factor 2B [Halobacteriales archaeon QS_5_70_15]|nr:MAG: initiation factor 2B [Halobacteriales archaeon QS_5_70_15]